MSSFEILACILAGAFLFIVLKSVFTGFYVVNQNERAVKTVFGRAKRMKGGSINSAAADTLNNEEKEELIVIFGI